MRGGVRHSHAEIHMMASDNQEQAMNDKTVVNVIRFLCVRTDASFPDGWICHVSSCQIAGFMSDFVSVVSGSDHYLFVCQHYLTLCICVSGGSVWGIVYVSLSECAVWLGAYYLTRSRWNEIDRYQDVARSLNRILCTLYFH